MAYSKDKLYKQALKAVSDEELFFIEDIVAFMPCDKTTFYRYFPTDSNEYNTLKESLESNKIKKKSEIRKKLFKSEKAAELLALYRLLATTDEHQRLNQQYIDHSSKDGSMSPKPNIIVSSEKTAKEIDKLISDDTKDNK